MHPNKVFSVKSGFNQVLQGFNMKAGQEIKMLAARFDLDFPKPKSHMSILAKASAPFLIYEYCRLVFTPNRAYQSHPSCLSETWNQTLLVV